MQEGEQFQGDGRRPKKKRTDNDAETMHPEEALSESSEMDRRPKKKDKDAETMQKEEALSESSEMDGKLLAGRPLGRHARGFRFCAANSAEAVNAAAALQRQRGRTPQEARQGP